MARSQGERVGVQSSSFSVRANIPRKHGLGEEELRGCYIKKRRKKQPHEEVKFAASLEPRIMTP